MRPTIPKTLEEDIEKIYRQNGYTSKGEFVRDAVRHQLQEVKNKNRTSFKSSYFSDDEGMIFGKQPDIERQVKIHLRQRMNPIIHAGEKSTQIIVDQLNQFISQSSTTVILSSSDVVKQFVQERNGRIVNALDYDITENIEQSELAKILYSEWPKTKRPTTYSELLESLEYGDRLRDVLDSYNELSIHQEVPDDIRDGNEKSLPLGESHLELVYYDSDKLPAKSTWYIFAAIRTQLKKENSDDTIVIPDSEIMFLPDNTDYMLTTLNQRWEDNLLYVFGINQFNTWYNNMPYSSRSKSNKILGQSLVYLCGTPQVPESYFEENFENETVEEIKEYLRNEYNKNTNSGVITLNQEVQPLSYRFSSLTKRYFDLD